MSSSGSSAEIGIDYLPMRADFGRGPGRQRPAEIEHGDVVADGEDQIGMMFHQQHADAGPGNRQERPAEPPALLRRKSGRRLVEQQESRSQHQRASNLREAQLAVLQPVGSY